MKAAIAALALCAIIGILFVRLVMSDVASSNTVSAQATVSSADQRAKAAQCSDTLTHHGKGVYKSMRRSGDYVSVVVDRQFLAGDFEGREAFTALVVCEYTEGRMDDSVTVVDFLDPRTHASIGQWHKGTGLSFNK